MNEWTKWFETTSKASTSTACDAINECICTDQCSEVAFHQRHLSLPYKKAPCYGYCPHNEPVTLVRCYLCNTWIKPIGYNAHFERRHRTGKKPAHNASWPSEIYSVDDGIGGIDTERSSPDQLDPIIISSKREADDFDGVLLSPTLSISEKPASPQPVVRRPEKERKERVSKRDEKPIVKAKSSTAISEKTENYVVQSSGLRLRITKAIEPNKSTSEITTTPDYDLYDKQIEKPKESKKKKKKHKRQEKIKETIKEENYDNDVYSIDVSEEVVHEIKPSTSALYIDKSTKDDKDDSKRKPILKSIPPIKMSNEFNAVFKPADGTFIALGSRQKTSISDIKLKAESLKRMAEMPVKSNEQSKLKIDVKTDQLFAQRSPTSLTRPLLRPQMMPVISKGADLTREPSVTPPPALTQEIDHPPENLERFSPSAMDTTPGTSSMLDIGPIDAPPVLMPTARRNDITSHRPPRLHNLPSFGARLGVFSDLRQLDTKSLLDKRRRCLEYLSRMGIITPDSASDDDEDATYFQTRSTGAIVESDADTLARQLSKNMKIGKRQYSLLVADRTADRYITAAGGLVERSIWCADENSLVVAEGITQRQNVIKEKQRHYTETQHIRKKMQQPRQSNIYRQLPTQKMARSRTNSETIPLLVNGNMQHHHAVAQNNAAPQLRALLQTQHQQINGQPPQVIHPKPRAPPPSVKMLPLPGNQPRIIAPKRLKQHQQQQYQMAQQQAGAPQQARLQESMMVQMQMSQTQPCIPTSTARVISNNDAVHPSQAPTPPMISSPMTPSPVASHYTPSSQHSVASYTPSPQSMTQQQVTSQYTSPQQIRIIPSKRPSIVHYSSHSSLHEMDPRHYEQQQQQQPLPKKQKSIMPVTNQATQYMVNGRLLTQQELQAMQQQQYQQQQSYQRQQMMAQQMQHKRGLLGNEPMMAQHQQHPNGTIVVSPSNSMGSAILSRNPPSYTTVVQQDQQQEHQYHQQSQYIGINRQQAAILRQQPMHQQQRAHVIQCQPIMTQQQQHLSNHHHYQMQQQQGQAQNIVVYKNYAPPATAPCPQQQPPMLRMQQQQHPY